MSRARDSLAPSWLPRQRRRYIDRRLRQLMRRDTCSLCGGKLKHNSRTFSGLDVQGNVAIAGECCISQITELFGMGLYSGRKYDFLYPRGAKSDIEPTSEQIADAIATYQEIVADTDKRLDGIERHSGVRTSGVSLLDTPWKDDDREWFEQNRNRSHRARTPFPGELDGDTIKAPAEYAAIMLVRQVEPGSRIRARLFLNTDSLPVPDDEAVTHALFDVAVQREPAPSDGAALRALVEKYSVARGAGQ